MGPQHARRLPDHRAGRVAGVVACGLLAFGLATAAAVYQRLQSNVEVSDADRYLGPSRPAVASAGPTEPTDGFAGRALNVLVVGIDDRSGANAAIGGAGDELNSDSTFLAHVSADRTRVDVVSVPRDSLLPRPDCLLPDGSTAPGDDRAMFNAAFAVGAGPGRDHASAVACTRRTFEQATGVRTDEHVIVTMEGVERTIDALDGVPICLPEAMDSDKARLHVPAGHQVFDGPTAIAFLRARTGTGNGLELGSDLRRLDRQHDFLEAVAQAVESRRLLRDPVRLLAVLDEATATLSVSPGLASLPTMAGLAASLRGDAPAVVTAVTVPTRPAADRPAQVEWTEEADDLWARIRADRPLVDPLPAPTRTRTPTTPGGTATPSAPAGGATPVCG